MARIPPEIAALVDRDKTVGSVPDWDDKIDPRYFKLVLPLAVGEVTVGGFELRLHISKQFVDRDAMVQLEYVRAGRRSAVELWRICWKRFHPHQNRGFPRDFAHETFDGSHDHRFGDNYLDNEQRMRAGSLPAAYPLDPVPGTLSDFLALCGRSLRITDIGRIRLPTVSGDLFWAKKDD